MFGMKIYYFIYSWRFLKGVKMGKKNHFQMRFIIQRING